jgi:hypothetical protein
MCRNQVDGLVAEDARLYTGCRKKRDFKIMVNVNGPADLKETHISCAELKDT